MLRSMQLPGWYAVEIAMKLRWMYAIALGTTLAAGPAVAQGTKVAIAISGWTGFAPLTLAKEAGIFAKCLSENILNRLNRL